MTMGFTPAQSGSDRVTLSSKIWRFPTPRTTPKVLQQPSNPVRRCRAHAEQLGSSGQPQAQLATLKAPDMHRALPPAAHQLCNARRVIAVGLVELHGQRRVHVLRVDAVHIDAAFTQGVDQPDREGAGLHANLAQLGAVLLDGLGQ